MISDWINRLQGYYTLKRTVSDPALKMQGTAVFKKTTDDCLVYDEQGSYFYNQQILPFYQKRYFIFKGSKVTILKEDKKTLHQIYIEDNDVTSRLLSFSAPHDCRQDQYFLHFKATLNTVYTHYTVTGPWKKYTISTLLTKEQQCF